MAEERVSLNPEDAIAGGLLDDVLMKWDKVRFKTWTYPKTKIEVVTLHIVMTDTETGEENDQQYWSMGSVADWAPSSDGTGLVPIGTRKQLINSTNGMLLLSSLANCGFEMDKVKHDISALDGLVAHMIRVPAPKRSGIAREKRKAADGSEYDDTILIVDEITKMPWEKETPAGAPGKKKAAGAKGKKKEEAPPDEGDSGEGSDKDDVMSFIMEKLAEAGDTGLTKKDLLPPIFQKYKKASNRDKIVQMAYDDEFLSDGPWKYENGTLTLG